ncbi:aspartate dehydrogenase domain-containing protein isoform X2 [Procambarus clarkii]|uniref:aspartate dehydrogenase domain-containing protein isoform X2 n=1 Tax=Procambarus clarkii TaxID=6728 RepID=UPI001E6706BA|nr:putative L-aspartate dehydrogenase isoform X2 [Procambarus clarkii]
MNCQYLTQAALQRDDLDLAFVWNRTSTALESHLENRYICRDLDECGEYSPDLIVEVAHPVITEKYGAQFLSVADYMVGSPTALASQTVEEALRVAATSHGLYVPAGALWGAEDILKMADRGTLKALKVTMTKHPSSFKLKGDLEVKNAQVCGNESVILYDGPVRGLCPLAPNNVNTMAAAAIAAHNLGFDGVQGSLISNPLLTDWHIVEVEVTGPEIAGKNFSVKTTRNNPADPGAVTGTATYASFLSSMVRAGGRGAGVHLC